MISMISGKIILEAHSHFTLVSSQLDGLKKYLENVEATTEVILSKMEILDIKV